MAIITSSSDPDWSGHCVEFVAERTGLDIWEPLGGCPRSWEAAAALYRRLGVRNLAQAVTAVLGPSVARSRAMRGDIVMIDGALGICRGEWVECMDGMQPMSKVTLAWHTPR